MYVDPDGAFSFPYALIDPIKALVVGATPGWINKGASTLLAEVVVKSGTKVATKISPIALTAITTTAKVTSSLLTDLSKVDATNNALNNRLNNSVLQQSASNALHGTIKSYTPNWAGQYEEFAEKYPFLTLIPNVVYYTVDDAVKAAPFSTSGLANHSINPSEKTDAGAMTAFNILTFGAGKIIAAPANELRVAKSSKILKALKFFKKNGCFVAGTLIKTSKGLKPIENIIVGDSVWAFDENSKSVTLQLVSHIYKRQVNQLAKISLKNELIWTTNEHPFWIDNQWKKANSLKVNDQLLSFNTSKITIENITIIDTSDVSVYNFTVESVPTYFVGENSVVAHNIPCDIADLIENITKKYIIFECEPCRDDLVKALTEKGISGDIIQFKDAESIFSKKAGTVISTNGKHTGVVVDGLFYDNIHKTGISWEDLIKDLEFRSMPTIIPTRF
jgi:hypothetical protein